MKRRALITGLGGLTASGTLVLGTGAFTSTSANRTVYVSVAQDDQAVLKLDDRGDGTGFGGAGRSIENSSDRVEFGFPGAGRSNEEDLGLGVDSIYEFDDDTKASELGLLGITNQGTQPVVVYSRHETDSELEIELYKASDPDRTALRTQKPELPVGEGINVGFRIQTSGAVPEMFEESLTIIAEGTNK